MAVRWLPTGHYSITSQAADLVGDETLRAFLQQNTERISFTFDAIAQPGFEERLNEDSAKDRFIPLANVPDAIWKHLPRKPTDPVTSPGRVGGRDVSGGGLRSDGPEHPNHYADIDTAVSGDTTWRDQCLADDALIDPDVWKSSFYEQLPATVPAGRQGLLPFRVWQMFDAMVERLRAADFVGFLAVAGVCAHYVGDACQPLHGSVLSNGDPSRQIQRWLPEKQCWDTVAFGAGVHEAYEGDMISCNAQRVIDGLCEAQRREPPHCENGLAAAHAILQLMHDVANILPPIDVVNSYQAALSKYEADKKQFVPEGGSKKSAIAAVMWSELGTRTITAMTEGAHTLAMIWDSAWAVGLGADPPPDTVPKSAVEQDALRALYIDPNFVPSKQLRDIKPILRD